MQSPTMMDAISVAQDTYVLPAYFPIPSMGILPVNAFLIHGTEPVLVDTGLTALQDEFLSQLRTLIPIEDLRWIWLTHTDPDHIGSLQRLLAAAPRARIVTTFLAMGKMSLHQPLPPERIYLLNPGQQLDVGDRTLIAVKPPSFDAPETTGLLDTRTSALYTSDCLGALMTSPAESAADIPAPALRDGLVGWATVDAPWLHCSDGTLFGALLDGIRRLDPRVVLSSHLPPARGMAETLLGHLASARTASPFEGPDQAALMRMLGAAA